MSLIRGSCIVVPDGRVIVNAETAGDELVVAEIDLEHRRHDKDEMFAFEKHRR
jgi:N-carbamoyl-D-amino-acid hydrolase